MSLSASLLTEFVSPYSPPRINATPESVLAYGRQYL